MFEFIGMAVVAWFAWLVIRSVVRGRRNSKISRSLITTKNIAINELLVPAVYVDYALHNEFDHVMSGAEMLNQHTSGLTDERLFATAIYAAYNEDINQCLLGSATHMARLNRIFPGGSDQAVSRYVENTAGQL